MKSIEAKLFYLADDGTFPNSELPVLLYEKAFSLDVSADQVERIFAENGWTNNWRNIVMDVDHYHSSSHEVLGIVEGEVSLQLGGENGIEILARAGDVLVLPAGIAHCSLSNSEAYLVVGGYPEGRSWDMIYAEPEKYQDAKKAISKLPIPTTDPIMGSGVGLTQIWTNQQKQSIRTMMQKTRAKLNLDRKMECDQWLSEELLMLIKDRKLKVIHSYLPMRDEIDIFPLIENMLAEGLIVVCPKTLNNRKLEHLVLKDIEALELGKFGTKHPKGTEIYQGKYDLIIVPGLAFDQQKRRLGYGGGYYDEFLSNHPEASKIGIYYDFQEVPIVPVEPHDVPIDQLIVAKTC